MAEDGAEDPPLEEGVQRREGHAEHTQEDVGESQVQDEVVGDGLHRLVPENGVHHQAVAEQPEEEDDRVDGVEAGLHSRLEDKVLLLGGLRYVVGTL